MGIISFRWQRLGLVLLSLLLVGAILAGCSRDAQFSEQEVQQFKQGPPKEMPPEAKRLFEKAMQKGVPRGPG
jgi:hypothetical protein